MPGIVPGIYVLNILAALTKVNLHALRKSSHLLILPGRKLNLSIADQGMQPFQSNAVLEIFHQFGHQLAILLVDLH